MRQHQWVEFAVTPIVILSVEGSKVLTKKVAQPSIRQGCMACEEPILSAHGTECIGSPRES